MAAPFSVPVIVAVPGVAEDVSVAVYVPFPLSVTAERLPAVVARTTEAPPLVKLFPLASLSCTVMVDLLFPFAASDVGAAVMVEVTGEAAPAVKVTVALLAIAAPFNMPVIVAVPAMVEDVSVAVYVPFPLSVTAERLPAVVARATVPPPLVRLFPVASLSCTVMVDVLLPSAAIEVGDAEIVEVDAEAAAAAKVTVALLVIAAPFSVPVIVAVPGLAEDVSVAEYVPFPLSVTAERLPVVVARATAAPPLLRLFPLASLSCTVMDDVLLPFAAIDVGEAVIVEVDAEAAPAVKMTVALLAIGAPFRVPVIVVVPAVVGDVSVAVYVPFPLSVTAERLPAVVASATVAPPLVRLFEPASLSCTVMVDVLLPSAVIEVGEAEIVEVDAEAAGAVKVTLALLAIAVPFRVPVIVAVPGVIEDVSVAV